MAVILTGCDTAKNHQEVSNAHDNSPSESRVINFQEGCKVGDQYTAIETAEAVWGGQGEPMILIVRMESELLRINNGSYTWKTTTYTNVEQMGDHQFIQGKGLNNNRLEYATYNSYGNLISTEGRDPDEGVAYNAFPEKPVSAGDTWQGYKLIRGKRFTNSYLLEAIANINGKEYAVVRTESEEDGGSSTSKSWIEISTGITMKSEGSGTGVNLAGTRGKWRYTYNIVDDRERPLLP